MKKSRGFSLIEILIVVALLSLFVFPLYFSYIRSQANQALVASAESVADVVRSAHVFAREARDAKKWGVRSEGERGYALVSGTGENYQVAKMYSLEPMVDFEKGFFVVFEIGVGGTENGYQINLVNRYKRRMVVEILSSGVVEVGNVE